MNCDQLKELLEAYTLGVLDPDEQVAVEQHLASCPDCRQAVEELAKVVHELPQALAAASALRPPASLKQRLLQSLEQEATSNTYPAGPEPGPRQQAAASSAAQAALSLSHKSGQIQPQPRFDRWRSRAAVVLAVLLLLVLFIVLGTRLSIVSAQQRALQVELANLFGQQELVLEVIDSEKTVRRVLLPPEPVDVAAQPPYGKLFTRPDLPHVVAMAARLAQPPPGQAYHLWLTEDGRTKLAGVLSINEQGFSLLAFDADRNGPVYDSAQLTLQPEGSTAPAGDPILRWAESP